MLKSTSVSVAVSAVDMIDRYTRVRQRTVDICAPLETEDYIPQPITDVSPPKWHLAHTTWFFEQFILREHLDDYRIYHPDFSYLFNSYYNHVGERELRTNRGFMTRPTVEEVYAYRQYVDKHIRQWLQEGPETKLLQVLKIGINHEQQHQELLVYDIKYILGTQYGRPGYAPAFQCRQVTGTDEWRSFSAGKYPIGAKGPGFCFDNETPHHEVYLPAFAISPRLVTNGEYMAFIADDGYNRFDLWHAEGWDMVQACKWKAPLYWQKEDSGWFCYTLEGLRPIDPQHPVQHISYYEAFAFAAWKGCRLPTEFEWEASAGHFDWGQLWEWTASAYQPYPGYQKAAGALGEYNGKFMVNQQVLKGASVATPPGHERPTYRNFFHASSRWIFSGIRLAK